ncbi:MAG: DUF333 domain-containing protein [Candidatus Parcubacteria bacterium]|nr:DUF333 domain-containing protein [Candidatus Parcubacteria bacterium]
MKKKVWLIIFIVAVAGLIASRYFLIYRAPATNVPAANNQPSQIANPASVNCTKVGGQLTMEKRGDGGEYGICFFLDNRQCEEWALLRGDCPVGGLKVTGYITPQAQYCAITGNTYQITNEKVDPETGNCLLKNGKTCDALDFYNGLCY